MLLLERNQNIGVNCGTQHLLKYALNMATNKMMFVDHVPNGLNCGCICPSCKQNLSAKNGGKIRDHHFAHHGDVTCVGARMTALHLLAQQIIEKEKKVMLPNYNAEFFQKSSQEYSFDKVVLENTVRLGDAILRPDCIGSRFDEQGTEHKLWIEIFVTNDIKKEGEKHKSICNSKTACIEIDLSELLRSDYTEESVTDVLIHSNKKRKWICCPNYDSKNEALKKEHLLKEERKQAEEKRLQDEIKIHKEQLYALVDEWYKTTESRLACQIINKIRTYPYSEPIGDVCIFNALVPNNNFLKYIELSPKNADGLEVYYTILNYYHNKSTRIQFNDLRLELGKIKKEKAELSSSELIRLEELISLNVIYWLERDLKSLPRDLRCESTIEPLLKEYIKSRKTRDEVLMVASVIYNHIVGTSSISYGDLTKEIIEKHPCLAKTYLDIIKYHDKDLNCFILEGQDIISELEQFVESHKEETECNASKILKIAYKYVYDRPKQNSENKEDPLYLDDCELHPHIYSTHVKQSPIFYPPGYDVHKIRQRLGLED